MKLQFIELQGFRGFREKRRFDLPAGFSVLSGRNGSGKSTMLDAVDFAITGTVNKFAVREARGGGLQEHIWWIGSGKASAHYVSVGFVDEHGKTFRITRTREQGCDKTPQEILVFLCSKREAANSSLETLMKTTLIRDELIAGLSLDLPEQARFAAVRAAIGGMVGPDYSGRTEAILSATNIQKSKQTEQIKALEAEISRLLGDITEARSSAERSSGISDAMQVIDSLLPELPTGLSERTETVRKAIADKRVSLRDLENARTVAEALQSEIEIVNSSNFHAAMESAQTAIEAAIREKSSAEERLQLALRLEASERAKNEYAAHLNSILEHGAAVGLQDGHCPLCNTAQSDEQFWQAISAAKDRLSQSAETMTMASHAVRDAQMALAQAERSLTTAQNEATRLQRRRDELETKLQAARDTYTRYEFDAPLSDPVRARNLLFAEREKLVQLERALSVLEASNAIDRVKTLEARVSYARDRMDQEASKLAAVERATELARQIDVSAKTVANQILTEQFDTVMPLLKELYRRLRPHASWDEIESDFGG